MNTIERKILLKALKAKMDVITSKSEALEHLKKIGILTPKGNISVHYKNLCIPQGQA